jgi:hypothetical protein
MAVEIRIMKAIRPFAGALDRQQGRVIRRTTKGTTFC